ncbi:metalloregulator ArsR/SmtB family transcription factor [Parvibaculum sp.]|jgi:DNA-binding transcriptional ArsR family regulator|uniref:ArsR/SmtB family transcription factor n=1 Tax=Parvibaculum sp. TaxID=2024848 RepID=UPI000C3969C2|nr:metalloregulator ArsR/SmtB family transcription factor [Parvibaculum sp.]MAM93700.1 transcriptional regulator [Parvibaculum sp.]HCX67708.1 transcriptional regulator [Rhodobiaceae bacterium]|tara:strand:+ start:141 stop:494 length:354 start_codon:yes stop_codon:yes gene_type:complete
MTTSQTAFDHTFIALADPTRRSVIEILTQGPQSVSELARRFTLALPTFMSHLRILERAGLITTKKTGRVRTCTLDVTKLTAAEDWMHRQRQLWETRLDQMDDYVKQLHKEETKSDRK